MMEIAQQQRDVLNRPCLAESLEDPVRSLQLIPLFSELNQGELRLIADNMRQSKKNAGSNLLVQGQPVPAVYIIREGAVEVLVNNDRVAQRGPLDSLGEMSCLSGEETASATVRTLTACLVWEIEHQFFLDMIAAIPSLRSKLYATITSRLQTLSHRFSEILKHIPHGIVKIDLQGMITEEYSSRCIDYLGIGQLAGKLFSKILFRDNPSLTEKWNQTLASFSSGPNTALISKLGHLPEEVNYRHPDGAMRVFNLFYHLTSNNQNQITGLDIGIDDVTRQKHYQAELSAFQDMMTNMEQLLVLFESQTGLILQETISHSQIGRLHFPGWKHLKGKNITDTILKQQETDQIVHFKRWLNMLSESFILESMAREDLIELAPSFAFETVTGDVVILSFDINTTSDGHYSEVLGKLEFATADISEEENRFSTMLLIEEIVAADEAHHSSLPEVLGEMQISLEFAQSQMATPKTLAINQCQVAGLIHSLKGLAQSFGLQTIATAAHELEDALENTIKGGQSPTLSDRLMSAYKSLLSLVVISRSLSSSEHTKDLGQCQIHGPEVRISADHLQEIQADLSQLIAYLKPGKEESVPARTLKKLQRSMASLNRTDLSKVFQRLERIVADTASLLRKQVEFTITEIEPLQLDLRMGHTINTCLIQLIKNAVFHGVETPTERKFLGKPQKAIIELTVKKTGEYALINVRDDGKGFVVEKILDRAVELNICDAASAEKLKQENRKAEVFAFLFKPGFSTAGSVSLLSGRGVGMSLVKSEIEQLGGSIQISSNENQGAEIILKIPLYHSETVASRNLSSF